MGVKLLWFIFAGFILFETVYLIIGLILAKTKRYHRRGVRLVADSSVAFWLTSRICRCPCDGSCDNWTCSKYRVPPRNEYRGKYEAIK